jgi:NAD(P)-dependent dehydrogenase (short-subunit alcohol dehydrogenase family)
MAISVSLAGKNAIVTGGGRGIGRAIASSLAEAGANVVIASRKLDNLEATAAELSGMAGKVVPVQCHVGKSAELEALVQSTERAIGPVDILVNNSATNLGQGPSLQTDAAQFDKMFEINVKAAYVLVHRVVPGMRERGGGSIINITSISGLQPQPGGLLYSFTKAGLGMLTRSWAREFGPWGIRVNAIAPGLIKTDFSAYFWADETRRAELVGDQPLQRLGQPEDIGFAAVYLASELASFVTGQTLVIDGGALA